MGFRVVELLIVHIAFHSIEVRINLIFETSINPARRNLLEIESYP